MLTLKIALRTLMRRKGRAILIGVLVGFGTFLIVFGTTFTASTSETSRASIIDNFTGDLIVYSDKSKELPSPFAFQTPLPPVQNLQKVGELLDSLPEIQAYVPYSQNYAIIQVEREGKKIDLPFIFYAVEPEPYREIFTNASMEEGSFFGVGLAEKTPADSAGVVISRYQHEQYIKNYGVSLVTGEPVTVLGVTEGGVNTVAARLVGIFEPELYKNVFDYINFIDAATYSQLYNFTGVESLPDSFNAGLEAALISEDALFELALDEDFGKLDVSTLKAEAVSGYTMIAVKLTDHEALDRVVAELREKGGSLGIKVATWKEASGFYATISSALQAFIVLATALIFLVVTLIFTNTLIINVVERTAEIGTMRALGTDKSFIRGLFLTETLILNIAASLVAMLISLGIMLALSNNGIPLPDTVSQFLVGGGRLPLQIRFMPFVQALVVVVVVSVLATLYPVKVATSITPLKAMSDK
ncbi:MAG: FtsX-like permease family protein [Spirochaetia bacterium]|jgi:putative ABC transport system permease protein|nr:FtsX-like permease family protein [Spirochaetia bacterium]